MKLTLLLCDILLLNVVYPLSVWVRFGNFVNLQDSEVKTIWLFANALWIGLVVYYSAYKLIRVERIENLLSRTFKLFLIHSAIISVCVIILDYDKISRLRMFYFFLIFYSSIMLLRVIYLKTLKYIRVKGYNFRNVIIIGCNENGRRIGEILTSDLSYGFRVAGYFDNLSNLQSRNWVNFKGEISDIEVFVQAEKIQEMYIALHYDQFGQIKDLIRLAEKYLIRIKFVPDFYNYTQARKVNIDFYGNTPVLMLRKEPLEQPLNRIAKKIFDISFSFLVIVLVFTWLFPILMILVKLSSAGPIFFKQKRSGEDNRSFTCLKFRSMRVNYLADELQATEGDQRITKIGAFMRRTNLDELPQFFNVLLGSMSVVGPRPHMLKHTEQYSELIHNYLVRHLAKPGITGWAQVNGYRGETKELEDMKKRVEYDIWYIENWSFLMDLKIIFKTCTNMIKGDKKAY